MRGCWLLFLILGVYSQKYIKIYNPTTTLHIHFMERIENFAIKILLHWERNFYPLYVMKMVSSIMYVEFWLLFHVNRSYSWWCTAAKHPKKLPKTANSNWWSMENINTLLLQCLWRNNNKLTFRCISIINLLLHMNVWNVTSKRDNWLDTQWLGLLNIKMFMSTSFCSVSNSQTIEPKSDIFWSRCWDMLLIRRCMEAQQCETIIMLSWSMHGIFGNDNEWCEHIATWVSRVFSCETKNTSMMKHTEFLIVQCWTDDISLNYCTHTKFLTAKLCCNCNDW